MFERSNLEELAAFEGSQPVVSLYLNLPPRHRGTPEAYRARLRGLLKEAAGQASEKDIAAIEDYFDKSFDWTGRSVAVFSSVADELWRVATFAVPFRSSTIYVGSKPFLMPLASLMDTYGAYSMALVDQQVLRMFHVHLGELVASKKLEGEEVKRIKAGGGMPGRSRGDDVSSVTEAAVRSNLKTFAEALAAFCKHYKTEHILLGGAEPALNAFEDELAQPWKDCVQGRFNIQRRASDSEVLQRSLEVMLSRAEEREAQLVEMVQTLAAKGANGAVGLADTLKAADEGRVQTLLLVDGAVAPDVAGPAIAHVLDCGGSVEFVSSTSPLAAHDGIGALLRY